MKKFIKICSLLTIILSSFLLLNLNNANITFAEEINYNINDDTIADIEEEVSDQLENLDFSSIDKFLNSLTNSEISIFGNTSFLGKIKQLLNGEFDDGKGLWTSIITIFFDDLLKFLPLASIIIAVSLIGSMIQGIRPTNNKSISNIVHFVTYGVIVVIILSIVVKMIGLTVSTLQNIKLQMDILFPILLTLLSAVGGTVSTSIYQPAMALLAGMILNLFTYVLLPIFIFSIVFSIVSNLSNSIKLDKFTSFFNSTYKWLVGLIFTVFTAFLSIQGITAGGIDNISIKTAKFAIKSYVPILGSYLSDGMGVILVSSNLIKNTVGATGLFLLLATILSPLIQLVLFMLLLKLMAGIIEPLGNKQIANFISTLSKNMVLLIVLIIGVAFVYFIMIGLVMCTANIL